MINWIFSLFQRPEKGWDPVPASWAEKYAAQEWGTIDNDLVKKIDENIGGLRNKKVLDLGGGPGQYTIAFAKKGAKVTWHDISRLYLDFVKKMAHGESLEITYSLGYLEEANKLQDKYDFIFNRVCWCYSMNDLQFTKIVYNLLASKGQALFIMDHTGCFGEKVPFGQKVRIFCNEKIGIKIGHPFCTVNHVKNVFSKIPFGKIEYTVNTDRIYVWVTK